VTDLAPLARLTALQSLNCSRTGVGDLAPLAGLTALQSLNCSGTRVSDLAPLAELSALQSLDCSLTQVSGLTALARLGALQRLDCSRTKIMDLALLASLSALRSLNCGFTQIMSLGPLSRLRALQSLNCEGTAISDLRPLSGLGELQSLNCESTAISDLGPLSRLRALQSLNCGRNTISDLAPLAALKALQSLKFGHTSVSDLEPLRELKTLRELHCYQTGVWSLEPLAHLCQLVTLWCWNTQITDLNARSNLSNLESLCIASTAVNDLHALSGLDNLRYLEFHETWVRDIVPLPTVRNLNRIYCSDINDLEPLGNLTNLAFLACSRCDLQRVQDWFLSSTSLRHLSLFKTRAPGVPVEVLSQQPYENCLESLRAHIKDLAAGVIALSDAKLIVLGNGRVGKTQICRRLRGEDYDARVPSTHGVIVTSASLPSSEGAESSVLYIWDFGGQDIYHGTHALFMRTRAAFLIVWTPEAESSGEHVWDGMTFRNHALPYWIDTVRHLGAAGSPVLIVQMRCDRLEDEVHRLPAPPELLAALPHWELQYSAFNNRRRAALDEALHEAVDRLRRQEGEITIGAGRLKVKQRLEQLRDADTMVSPEQREYRTLTQEHFRQLCNEAGDISAPGHLLSYLHNAGIVFYRQGLFDDRIVLDQGWALEAIYAVFNRETCYRPLRHLRGRFTRAILEALVWREYSAAEQEVFLGMLGSCGICFVHYRRMGDEAGYEEYIAPDLLPERDEIQAELDAMWDEEATVETSEFEYPLLHPGIVRSVISRIGSEAGVTALYWRGGLCVYETTTRSRALIEQEMANGWRGKILIRTQRGQAAELLRRFSALVLDESTHTGAQPVNARPADRSLAPSELSSPAGDESIGSKATPPLQFSQEHGNEAQYFVSYAWADESPEGKQREAVVDRLCEAAEQRGLVILRDKHVLHLGDSISKFMQRLAEGDRVFVFLSDKYLHSPYCMYELMEIWRKCSAEEEKFLTRVRVYVIPGTKIFSLSDRALYAVYWQQEYEKVHQLIHDYGSDVVGPRGFREYKLMGDFRRWVAEILETVADRLQPREFEDLARYGLDDLVPRC